MTTPTNPAAAALVLSLLSGVLDERPQAEASSEARDTGVSATRGGHLGPQSTLRDVLHHPSFAGFSRLLLPWDDRAYDEQMPLTRVGSLLPYHSHVDPETVASALNRMIDEAARGRIARRAVRGRLPRWRVLLCRLRP